MIDFIFGTAIGFLAAAVIAVSVYAYYCNDDYDA